MQKAVHQTRSQLLETRGQLYTSLQSQVSSLYSPLNDCRQMVSGSISLRSPRFFSPFPHGTCSLLIQKQYLALEGGPPIFSQDFSCPDLLIQSIVSFCLRDYHPLWLSFPTYSTNTLWILGLLQFRSPLLSESRLISFPTGTEMFHFPAFASSKGYHISLYGGLPHSDTPVSTLLDSSTRLFAVQCVLLRLF